MEPEQARRPFKAAEVLQEGDVHFMACFSYEGVVLIDRGGRQKYRKRYEEKIAAGVLERRGLMWVWHHGLEPPDSPRLAARLKLQEDWARAHAEVIRTDA